MAVGHDAYPTVSDLSGFLTNAGIPPAQVTALATAAAIQAGIQSFERACSRHFLAGKAIDNSTVGTLGEETRYFDPPCNSRELDLGPFGDLPAVPTSVIRQPAGSSPTTLTLYTDYWPLPENALSMGGPYTSIAIKYPGWGAGWYYDGWGWPALTSALRSIQVTGKWGYGLAIPDDAWQAMLQSAALWVEGQYRLKTTRGTTGFSVTGGVQFQFGIESYTNIVKGWQDRVDMAVSVYRRVEV